MMRAGTAERRIRVPRRLRRGKTTADQPLCVAVSLCVAVTWRLVISAHCVMSLSKLVAVMPLLYSLVPLPRGELGVLVGNVFGACIVPVERVRHLAPQQALGLSERLEPVIEEVSQWKTKLRARLPYLGFPACLKAPAARTVSGLTTQHDGP